jgi:carbamoyl-phosphate synthase large subunit
MGDQPRRRPHGRDRDEPARVAVSALASKATGFPIAKIAAKLAVGYTLDELDNDITKVTPASFEPHRLCRHQDPRFAFEKFPGSEPNLTTAMKSVGEAMAIGRTFHESLQKALAAWKPASPALTRSPSPARPTAPPSQKLSEVTPDRLRVIAQAMRMASDDDIQRITAFDPGSVPHPRDRRHRGADPPDGLPVSAEGLRKLKMMGFTDARLAKLTGRDEAQVRRARSGWRDRGLQAHRHLRRRVRGPDPYMYSTYEAPAMGDVECESRPSAPRRSSSSAAARTGSARDRVRLLLRHACYALTAAGYETIMVNCNPETVSTDYDTSDRLYFEPLTLEHVWKSCGSSRKTARCTASSCSSAARRR